jgi:ribosome recycling factor
VEPSRDAEEMSERLASIRVRLARMREESRRSLARLSETDAEPDERAAVRSRDEAPAADPPPAP